MIVNSLPTNLAMQTTYGPDNPPGAGARFVQGLMSGLETTTPGLLISGDAAREASLGVPLSEPEWKESEWHREGLEYRPGMTREFAEILAHRRDKNQARAFAAEQSGFGGKLANLAGEFVGSIPDPMNFLPLVAPAMRAKMALSLGKVAGGAAAGALEAGAGAALLQPFLAAEFAQHQDPYDWTMAAENILIAMGIGSTLGGGLSWLERTPTPDRLAAASKATADVVAGRPVDTGALAPAAAADPAALRQVNDLMAGIDRQLADAAPEARAPLQEARNALDAERVRLEGEAAPDMAVAQRTQAPMPDTAPTTKANAFEPVAPDEVDFSVVEQRFKDMLDNKLLDDDDLAPIKAATEQKKTADAYARAYEIAGNCLLRTK